MQVTPSAIPDVLLIEPRVFGDARGFFLESFNQRAFAQATGLELQFVQDNHSRSSQGVLRGLHYQIEQAQGKLVRVVRGRVFDVAVDLRRRWPPGRSKACAPTCRVRADGLGPIHAGLAGTGRCS